ncbi:hypothetical protein [Nocardioides stalactiti]|uniref:hypothetical protein n=1 Tax=Nocardioides stalactiti TaxID=2755356 RepID=UPI0015FF9892|nr:hypothetical protein [Nocardioides stalactiti]
MTAEQLDVADIVGEEIDLPCGWHSCEKPAEWIVWTNHRCEVHVGHGLSCDDCLRRVLTTPRGLVCETTGERLRPARAWINRFERINKPPAANTGARDH